MTDEEERSFAESKLDACEREIWNRATLAENTRVLDALLKLHNKHIYEMDELICSLRLPKTSAVECRRVRE